MTINIKKGLFTLVTNLNKNVIFTSLVLTINVKLFFYIICINNWYKNIYLHWPCTITRTSFLHGSYWKPKTNVKIYILVKQTNEIDGKYTIVMFFKQLEDLVILFNNWETQLNLILIKKNYMVILMLFIFWISCLANKNQTIRIHVFSY